MKNLNAEQIKKALECCVKVGGYRDAEICNDCPLSEKRCAILLPENALSLINSQEQRIKELGEDNEYLKTQVTATEARYESRKESDIAEKLELRLKVEELTEENERLYTSCTELTQNLHECKADTVRKMQERFNEKVAKLLISPSIQYQASAFIDQIAKEVLDATECENKGEEICKNIHQKK